MASKTISKFRETSIGEIPEEWQIQTVEELVTSQILEKPMDGNHGGIHPKQDDYVSAGIPFVMASDINEGTIDLINCKFIKKTQADTLQKGFSFAGDVLLTHKGVIGRTAIVGKIETDYVMLTPQVTYYRIKDKSKLDNRFLKYYFDTKQFQRLFKSWAGSGSTRDYLGITEQRKLPILLPSIHEQKGIANVLSVLDSKIELGQSINMTLEAVGQAVFRRWFVDFEFPNEGGKPYKSSGGEMIDAGETGKEIPKGWKVGRIEDIADVVGGGTPSTKVESYFTNTGIHWLTPKDLSGFEGKFIDRGATDITEEGLKNSSAKLTPKGTILFTSRAPIGYIAIALNSITTNQGFKSLIPKNGMQTEYLYQYLRMITPYVQSISCGSTFGEISGKAMKGIEIVIPEKLTVKKFEEFMAPVNSRIINNIFGVRTLKEIRDSLLPRLMSGRIRVPVEERMADNRK